MAAKRGKKGRFVKARRKARRKAKRVVVAKRRRSRSSGAKRPAMGYVQGSKRIRRRKLNPRRRSYRRHHNPRFSVGGIVNQLTPAAFGAAGGIALDVALGYVPLPDMLKTGYAKHATRIVGALGLGWVARKFMGRRGGEVAAGALTVAMYSLFKDVLVHFAPSVKGLGDYEEFTIADTSMGAYMDPAQKLGAYLPDGSTVPGMGAYLQGDMDLQAMMNGMDY